MIKYILRKPLFPILLLVLMTFEVLFMGILKRGIERDMQKVDEMYDNAVITYEALPETNAELKLRPHFTYNIESREEVESAYSLMCCPYTLRKPESVLGNGCFYGTNDVHWLLKSRSLETEWLEGYEYVEEDWKENDEDIPCVVDAFLLKDFNLNLGDHFVAAPYDKRGVDSEKAPGYNFYIVGSFVNEAETLEKYSLIIPQCVFEEPPSAMFNTIMMERYCAFIQYEIRIKKKYNRQADEVEERMQEVFKRARVTFHSDARVLQKAVRPIEQRLKIQKALEKPMEIALLVATALLAVLVSIGIQDDVFLFLLHGESKGKAFGKTLINIAGIILMAAVFAALCALIVLGMGWLDWILLYTGANVLLCILAAAVPVMIFCNKNLVNFYQTKEA